MPHCHEYCVKCQAGDLMFCLEGSAISGQKLCTSCCIMLSLLSCQVFHGFGRLWQIPSSKDSWAAHMMGVNIMRPAHSHHSIIPSFHHSISRFGHARIALSGLGFVKQLPEQTIMESFQPYNFTVPWHASQHSQVRDGRKYIKSSCTHTHTHTIREFHAPKVFMTKIQW